MEYSDYFRVELIGLIADPMVLKEDTEVLKKSNESLMDTYKITCSLAMLQSAYAEEISDEVVEKLRDIGLLDFNPVQIKFVNGLTRTLYHSFSEYAKMMDELSSIDQGVYNRVSYNLQENRYGIKDRK
jgi:hypothetical protein